MKCIASSIVNNGTLVAIIDGVQYMVPQDHPHYNVLRSNFHNEEWEDFVDNESYEVGFNNAVSQSGLTVEDGVVNFNGVVVENYIADRIYDLYRQGEDFSSLVALLENINSNPSFNSREQLPDFLNNQYMPLTEDGCFLAYKSVGSDFYSKRAGVIELLQGTQVGGRILNSPGEVIECDRSAVDDNPSNHCSTGLHAGAFAYGGIGGTYNGYGDKVVIVKINPIDCVSVPSDNSFQKLRTCKYEVVCECKDKLTNAVYKTEEPHNEDEYREEEEYDTEDNSIDIDDIDLYAERRFLQVEDRCSDYLEGFLMPEDKSYDEDEDEYCEYRKFKITKMSNVELIV